MRGAEQFEFAPRTIFGLLLAEIRFQKIDNSNRGDHLDLSADDEVYYLFEYTSGKNYSFSSTNNLISNLKKKPSTFLLPGYHYKRKAIRACASALATGINQEWLQGATLVPIPPSKIRDDPDYDDRITKVCRSIGPSPGPDVREIVYQTSSLKASHISGERPTLEQLIGAYAIDETKLDPLPSRIGIVDDVLTNGRHFRAMRTVLSARLPACMVVGFFIARRVFPPMTDFEDTVF